MKIPTIVPFVKWLGGKRQILPEILERVPSEFNTYYEPFVGGGALLFALQPKHAVVNDINKELMNVYKTIKKSPKRLREYLLLMEMGHTIIETFEENKKTKHSPFYDKVRLIDRCEDFDGHKLNMKDSNDLLAARFIYMNKNNFNGIYRVNSSGYYNVPSKHLKSVKTFEWDNLKKVSKYLKYSVEIKNTLFDESCLDVKKGDFVYFDPPYDYEEGQNGFDAYQKKGFGREGQFELAEFCKLLNKWGVKFMVSNHNTKYVKKLYSDFKIEVISANRNVGGKGASRDKVQEVLIRNYE